MRYHLLIWMVLVAGSALAQGQIREVFMCKDATLRIRAASAGAVRYQWFMNNQLITGSSSPELQVSQEGTYKAQGVNADGCESGESVYVVVKHNKPSAIDDIATGKVNTELLIDVLKNDLSECAVLDNAALEIVSGPASGTALCTNGKLSYTPPRDFEGLVTVQYKVRDHAGQSSNVALVKIEILADPLPVKLAYFDLQKTDHSVVLHWGAVQEINSAYYEIQHSEDARSWGALGSVEAAQGTDSIKVYAFEDSLPDPGLNYYRLKMVDTDGSFTYSRARSANFPDFSWAMVYPNPVDDQLSIVIRNRKVNNIRLISHSGSVRMSWPVTTQALTISMKQYPVGMYYIQFEQQDGAVRIFKLMHH